METNFKITILTQSETKTGFFESLKSKSPLIESTTQLEIIGKPAFEEQPKSDK